MASSESDLKVRQRDPVALQLLAAASELHRRSDQVLGWRRLVGVLIATVAVVGVLLGESTTPWLAGIAGAWSILDRAVLADLREGGHALAVRVQEQFDCRVLGLVWNDALAGDEPLPEEVSSAARAFRGDGERLESWYPQMSVTDSWQQALLAQRSSAVWGMRDLRVARWLSLMYAVSWVVIGLTLGVVKSLSLGTYLLELGLPMLPVVLDELDAYRERRAAAAERQDVERFIDGVITNAASGAVVDARVCRSTQDRLFITRLRRTRAPAWLYRRRRLQNEVAMQDGTDACSRRLKAQSR